MEISRALHSQINSNPESTGIVRSTTARSTGCVSINCSANAPFATSPATSIPYFSHGISEISPFLASLSSSITNT